jgi:hypothetical protein
MHTAIIAVAVKILEPAEDQQKTPKSSRKDDKIETTDTKQTWPATSHADATSVSACEDMKPA